MAKAKVRINEAGRDELAELPGIGPATAATLMKLREERGGFKTVEELEEVPGIGAQTLKDIRPLVTVANGGSPARKAPESAAKTVEAGTKAGPSNGATAKAADAGRSQTGPVREAGIAGAGMVRETVDVASAKAKQAAESTAEMARQTAETGSARAQQATQGAAEMQHDLMGAMRAAQEAWVGLVQEQMAANVQIARRLAECRNPQDLAGVQAEYLRGSMERMIQGTARVAGPTAHLARAWWSPERWQHWARR